MRIRSAQLTQNQNQIGYAWYPRRAVASFSVERSSEVTLWRHRVVVRFLPIILIWKVNFKIELPRIKNIWIDAAWREEHDSVKIILLALTRAWPGSQPNAIDRGGGGGAYNAPPG